MMHNNMRTTVLTCIAVFMEMPVNADSTENKALRKYAHLMRTHLRTKIEYIWTLKVKMVNSNLEKSNTVKIKHRKWTLKVKMIFFDHEVKILSICTMQPNSWKICRMGFWITICWTQAGVELPIFSKICFFLVCLPILVCLVILILYYFTTWSMSTQPMLPWGRCRSMALQLWAALPFQ